MAFKAKLPLLLFLFGSFLLCFTSSLAYEKDPEQQLQQCTGLCEKQEKFRDYCKLKCGEEYVEQKKEQERRGEGGSSTGRYVFNTDPQKESEQCQHVCELLRLPLQKIQQCKERCEEKRREKERQEQRGEGEGGSGRDVLNTDPEKDYEVCYQMCKLDLTRYLIPHPQTVEECQESCFEKLREEDRKEQRLREEDRKEQRRRDNNAEKEEGQQEGRNNPYFFDEQSFIEKYRTEEGRIRVLPKFTQRSNLHRGIENYRLAIFEANPNTFVIPNHWDADAVIYVVKGRGTISMIRNQNRDSLNLERGDVIRVPSGSVVYMVNRDNNEQLQIAKLYQPISKTGHVQEFFGVGAEEPESFYRTFSNDVLKAAFNTPIDQLERLFGQQRKGVIIRASKEQVQALSKQASSSSKGDYLWPRGGGSESRGPYNILNEKPKYSNNHGELYEVKPNDYKQLQDLDIAVSFTNITKGAMMAPNYNTRATKLILVVEGRGRFEMACPHLARQSQQHSPRRGEQKQEQEQGGAHYQRVSAHLSPKTMFIVPTGHPVAIIASDNENLQLVAFTINAQDSKRNFLAGKENVVNQMEKEAIELGFNMPSKEVQEIYNRQKESVFVPGPNQCQQQRERGSHGLSILDFVNF